MAAKCSNVELDIWKWHFWSELKKCRTTLEQYILSSSWCSSCSGSCKQLYWNGTHELPETKATFVYLKVYWGLKQVENYLILISYFCALYGSESALWAWEVTTWYQPFTHCEQAVVCFSVKVDFPKLFKDYIFSVFLCLVMGGWLFVDAWVLFLSILMGAQNTVLMHS